MSEHRKTRRIVVTGQKSSGDKTQQARILRQNMTTAEKILWKYLRNHQVNGFHFRRQQVINGFIADFYCHKASLVVEIDGATHDAIYDQERDQVMSGMGITVLRVTNEAVIKETEAVITQIREYLKS